MKIKTILLFSLFLGLTAEAKVFRNAYVSFEMRDDWNCNLEHTEWVCRSNNDKSSKEAIIILTAKEVGPTDTFESYVAHLNNPQKTRSGAPSKVVYASKKVQINDQPWIDGLHMASEVNNYYTRYLATIKDRVAILVTYSAHKDVYTNYATDFFKSVQSLRVIATKNMLADKSIGPLRPGSETIGAPINAAMPGDMSGVEITQNSGGSGGGSKTKNLLMLIAILLAGAGIYIYLKSNKK